MKLDVFSKHFFTKWDWKLCIRFFGLGPPILVLKVKTIFCLFYKLKWTRWINTNLEKYLKWKRNFLRFFKHFITGMKWGCCNNLPNANRPKVEGFIARAHVCVLRWDTGLQAVSYISHSWQLLQWCLYNEIQFKILLLEWHLWIGIWLTVVASKWS